MEEKKRNGSKNAQDQKDKRMNDNQQEGNTEKKTKTQQKQDPQIPMLTCLHITSPALPSNLMIRVCSHFHSDRKGAMRKIKEAVRVEEEKQIR